MNANNPMVNEARVDCKSKAETQAKYGSPKWPWFAFSHFRPGDDSIKTGVVVFIEPEHQFSNAFGAMLHARATYRYDLNHPHQSPNNSNVPDVVLDEAP